MFKMYKKRDYFTIEIVSFFIFTLSYFYFGTLENEGLFSGLARERGVFEI
jgi:hypothetical protein